MCGGISSIHTFKLATCLACFSRLRVIELPSLRVWEKEKQLTSAVALAEARMWSNEDAECFYYQFWVAFQVESWESKFYSKGDCPCHCHSFDQIKWEGELNLFREGGKHLSAVISNYNAQPNLFNVFECCHIKINLETTIRWRDPCNSFGGWGHSLGTLDTVCMVEIH